MQAVVIINDGILPVHLCIAVLTALAYGCCVALSHAKLELYS